MDQRRCKVSREGSFAYPNQFAVPSGECAAYPHEVTVPSGEYAAYPHQVTVPSGGYIATRLRCTAQSGTASCWTWQFPQGSRTAVCSEAVTREPLLEKARRLTGVEEKTTLVHAGLQALIARESARRLAALGQSEPRLKAPRLVSISGAQTIS
jgi:Bacterial antitoxin of type II TA system, VapB